MSGLAEDEVQDLVKEHGDVTDVPDVGEVWPPPRVTAKAVKRGLTPGPAIDILTGYDLLTARGRKRAWDVLRRALPHRTSAISSISRLHEPT